MEGLIRLPMRMCPTFGVGQGWMTGTEKEQLFDKFLVFYFITEDVEEYSRSVRAKAWECHVLSESQ